MGGITGEQPAAQRKTACCNCSSWFNRPMGSSTSATSVSSCCFWTGSIPDSRSLCSGVFAGSSTQRISYPVAFFRQQFHRGLKTVHIQAQRPVELGQLPIGLFSNEAVIAHHLAHNGAIFLLDKAV